MGFGTRTLSTGGQGAMASADGLPEYKVGGVTVDWGTVPANSADVTLPDGIILESGMKYLPFGCILALITQTETQTVDLALATAGTFTLTIPGFGTTATIAFGSSAAAAQTAIAAVIAGATVLKATTILTVTFPASAGDVGQMTANIGSLTGTVAIATTYSGLAQTKYGPYDTAATDGRQTLSRGKCVALNVTARYDDLHSENPPGALIGGRVHRQKIKKVSGGAFVQVWDSNVEAAFPRLVPVDL